VLEFVHADEAPVKEWDNPARRGESVVFLLGSKSIIETSRGLNKEWIGFQPLVEQLPEEINAALELP
jgi:hypothetical protein